MSRVQCQICPNMCVLEEGKRGLCRIRINLDGDIYALTYGKPCAVHVDPVEKKPAYHFLPGTKTFSIATAGCCLDCKYCQNWQISQADPEDAPNYDMPSEHIVKAAARAGCQSVAYTYTEPTVFFEYMIDTARVAHQADLDNIFVTCGFINQKPLEELAEVIDMANVDLKAFNEKTYFDLTRGQMKPVLNTIKYLHAQGVIVEVTHLVVPTFTDSLDEIKRMSIWLAEEVSPDIPLHLSRFFPNYKLKHLPPTPVSFIAEARDVARSSGLHNVYVGNVAEIESQDTVCPECATVVLRRKGYHVLMNQLTGGRCPACNARIYGKWDV
jgi:pyruvate formate lyase activating enzyme